MCVCARVYVCVYVCVYVNLFHDHHHDVCVFFMYVCFVVYVYISLLFRILYTRAKEIVKAKRMKKKRISPLESSLQFSDILDLVSHAQHFPSSVRETLSRIMVKLETIIDTEVQIARDICVSILLRIQCNAHTIMDDNRGRIALALYPTASYINHSCEPNCVYSFCEKGLIQFRAIKPIKQGQQIYYSYVDLYQVTRIRQEKLMRSYFVDCKCGNACVCVCIVCIVCSFVTLFFYFVLGWFLLVFCLCVCVYME